MLSRRGIRRLSPYDIIQVKRLREIVEESANILKRCPTPDTFLGLKTHEPFPKETATKTNRDALP